MTFPPFLKVQCSLLLQKMAPFSLKMSPFFWRGILLPTSAFSAIFLNAKLRFTILTIEIPFLPALRVHTIRLRFCVHTIPPPWFLCTYALIRASIRGTYDLTCAAVSPHQSIPQISSLTYVTTAVPLVLVLALTALKDGIDDIVSAATGPHRQGCGARSRMLAISWGIHIRSVQFAWALIGNCELKNVDIGFLEIFAVLYSFQVLKV